MDKKRSNQYDKVYMEMATVLSQLSHGVRSKVGCLIVSPEGQIISQGFNGTPYGRDNCCETVKCTCQWRHGCTYTVEPPQPTVEFCKECDYAELTTKSEVLHAESNAIVKCARNGYGTTDGATLYVTLSPCYDCAKLIIQAGIKRVVYKEKYRDTTGISFLKENGIKVNQI